MRTATATTRSAVISRAAEVDTIDAPLVEPGAGEIRVTLEGCGVCGSDLPLWEGREWFEYPREPGAPGHEGWGTVDAVGEDVDGLAIGDRVAILGDRSYAEHDVTSADRAVVLPRELDDQPFPGEPLACAVNAFARSGIGAGDTIAVVGVGFLGALLIALAAARGARVIALSRRATARDAAAAMGAAEQLALDASDDVAGQVAELTDGRLCDVVIEAAGVQSTLDLCGPLARERGRVVIAGFHQDGPRQVDMQLWNWRGLDVVNAHERDPAAYVEGMRRAVQLVAQGRLDPRPLYTHRFALADLGDAFAIMRERPEGFMKALVTP